jgi:hypothetical protein
VPARRGAGHRHVAAGFRQHGQLAACRFRRRSGEDRGPQARRPAARLADKRHQRPLEGLFAQQEECGAEPARAARTRIAVRPDRRRRGADRKFPAGDARGDRARPRPPAPAQSPADHPAGFGLGPGRTLSRPPRLWHPGREHVGLCLLHRLCRSRAGLTADGTRRHGRRPLRGDVGVGRVARDRSQRRQRPGNRPAIARSAVLVHRDRSGDLPSDWAGPRAHRAAAPRRPRRAMSSAPGTDDISAFLRRSRQWPSVFSARSAAKT